MIQNFLTLIKTFFLKYAFLFCIVAAGCFIGYKIVHIPAQLELVILFAVSFFYPVMRFPFVGIYLLFVILPFVPFVRRLYYLQFSRPTADPLIVIGDIIIMLMTMGLFFEFRARKDQENDTKTISMIIMIYFCYLLLRTFVLNSLPASEAILRFRFYGPSVLLFFIGIFYATNTKLLKNIWIITLFIGALAALYGLKQLYYGYSEAERLWFSSISFTTLFIAGIARPFSLFQSPASFADYMILSIIASIILIGWKKSAGKYGCFLLLPLFFYGALITSVRSNWIGILICFVLWATVVQFKGNRNRIIVISLLACVFAVVQMIDAYTQTGLNPAKIFSLSTGGIDNRYVNLLVNERVSAISNPFEEHSLLSRVSLWRYLVDLSRIPELAIFGRGVGVLNADSLYFTYLAELGYPGVIFIIWLTVFFIVKSFSLCDKAPAGSTALAVAKGVAIMNIVFAVVNITGTHIHSFPGDAYFWFWNGVVIKLETLNKEQSFNVQNIDDT